MSLDKNLKKFDEENDFWLNISDVKIGKKVGEGQFSSVFIGKYFGDIVAVKKQTRSEDNLDIHLLRELSVLKNVSHRNLMNYIGAHNELSTDPTKPNALYIITEYCQGGDLLELLKSDKPLGWKFRIRVACECASALKYLHGLNLIHRDVKSSNILLDGNWTCKLSDFGMAREVSTDENNSARRMTICGTNEYMSPELLFDEEYSNSVDVFSFGMVLLEIMKRQQVGKRAESSFAARYPQNSFVLDVDAVQEALPTDAPPSLVMLALQCCEYDVADRPFADDVYEWLLDLGDSFDSSGEVDPEMPPIPDDMIEEKIGTPKKVKDEKGLRRLHSLVEIQSPDTILKAGIIHKKNRNGFKNWKERFLVLTPYQVRWYVTSKDLTCEKGHIDLISARVGKTRYYRFVILDPNEEYKPGDPHAVYHREFAADGEDAMVDWINAIQTAINNLKSVDKTNLSNDKSDDKAVSLGTEEVDDTIFDLQLRGKKDGLSPDEIMAKANVGIGHANVEEWLSSLNLAQYVTNFKKHGYTDLRHINEFGLHTDDFNYMGITHPLHKRVLRVAAVAEYSNSVRAAVTDWQDIGSVVVYKVVSRWRFSRSCVYLKYSEFKKMHQLLLKQLKKPECAKLRASLPSLPDSAEKVIQTKSAAFCNQRREALEIYLLGLIGLLSGTPMMKIVLETIGIVPRTLDLKVESRGKGGNVKRIDSMPYFV